MRKFRTLFGACLSSVLIVVLASPAFAGQWAPVNGVTEVCFQPSGLSAAAVAGGQRAAQQWNSVTTGLRVTQGDCTTANVVVMDTRDLGSSNTLGVTNWLTRNDFIVSASITYDSAAINAWGTETGSVANAWHGVMCHEMGHALGLDHSTQPDSCLQTGTFLPALRPGAADIAELRRAYGGSPAGSTTTTTVRPTTSTTRVPATSTTVRPTTSTTRLPVTSTTVRPTTSTTRVPATSTTVQTATTSTTVQTATTSTTVRPTTSTTVRPTTTTTERPTTSTTRVPVTSTTVRPTSSTTVRPTTSTTRVPVTSTSTTVRTPRTTTTTALSPVHHADDGHGHDHGVGYGRCGTHVPGKAKWKRTVVHAGWFGHWRFR